MSLGTSTLRGGFKTEAGTNREVDVPVAVVEKLTEWIARRPTYLGEDDPLFLAEPKNGQPVARQTKRNVQQRLKSAIKRANVKLAQLGIEPISERVTPHSLRRTYASLRAAAGDDPVYIAEQLGHADMALTYRVYQRAVKRRSKLTGNHLREFDRALDWAKMGGTMDAEPLMLNGQRMGSNPTEGAEATDPTGEMPANQPQC